MSTAYRFTENEVPHFITMTIVEWMDLFNRQKYKDILIDNLRFCIKEKGLNVHAYVIMSNHVHMIVSTHELKELSGLIRDFKRYTAKVMYETLKSDTQESRRNWMLWIIESQGERSSSNEVMKIWRHENHPVPLYSEKLINQRLKYIHDNPVRAGICRSPVDYVYSSAASYSGEPGLIPLSFL